ncbi:unnamed protein product [Brassica rapa]|uniref:Nascent polypeptide-associated complex subunit beta n=2 Tax=Brassica campestris TaxID=3711 RepID=A0A8D9M5Z5_BRACM|nr:unnamed protein product [Brassica rapa]
MNRSSPTLQKRLLHLSDSFYPVFFRHLIARFATAITGHCLHSFPCFSRQSLQFGFNQINSCEPESGPRNLLTSSSPQPKSVGSTPTTRTQLTSPPSISKSRPTSSTPLTRTASRSSSSSAPLFHSACGSGVEVTIKELAELVKEVVGFEGKLVWDCSKPDGTPRNDSLCSSSVLISLMRLNECGFCMVYTQMNREKLMKMATTVRTGGKGTVRRKKKAVHKTNTTDDKKLQSTLKRIGVNSIPAIEEVNIFKDDVVIQFTNPKVQASVGANTWVVSGSPQTKKLEDILPQILSHLGPDNMENLKKLAEQFKKQSPGGGNVPATIQEDDDEDDDVPELVAGETFEAAAEEKVAAASS